MWLYLFSQINMHGSSQYYQTGQSDDRQFNPPCFEDFFHPVRKWLCFCDYFLEEKNTDKSSVTVRGCNVFHQKLLNNLISKNPLMSSASFDLNNMDIFPPLSTNISSKSEVLSTQNLLKVRIRRKRQQKVKHPGSKSGNQVKYTPAHTQINLCPPEPSDPSESTDSKKRGSTKPKSCYQVPSSDVISSQPNKRRFYKVLISFQTYLFC